MVACIRNHDIQVGGMRHICNGWASLEYECCCQRKAPCAAPLLYADMYRKLNDNDMLLHVLMNPTARACCLIDGCGVVHIDS